MKKLVIGIIIVLLIGTGSIIFIKATGWYPGAGYPMDYRNQVKEMISMRLFDPYSAVYEFENPPKMTCNGFHYEGTVLINAKNRYGAYVGEKKFHYVIISSNICIVWEYGTERPALAICTS